MTQNYRHKIDSLLDNDSDISSPGGDNSAVVNHGGASHARVLLLILPDGNERFLHYNYLVDAEFQMHTGDIILTFTSHVVTLRGLRLHSLFRDLSRHEPHMISVVEGRYESLADKKAPLVTVIEIIAK